MLARIGVPVTLLAFVALSSFLSCAHAADADIVAARTMGQFELVSDEELVDGIVCAATISQRDVPSPTANTDASGPAFTVPHQGIDHGSSNCNTPQGAQTSTVDIYTSVSAPDAPEWLKSIAGQYTNFMRAGGFFARDTSGRLCGEQWIPQATVFGYLSIEDDFEFSDAVNSFRKMDELEGGYDYMFLVFPLEGDPSGDGAPVCIYRKESTAQSRGKLSAFEDDAPEEASDGDTSSAEGDQSESDPDTAGSSGSSNGATSDDGFWSGKNIGIIVGVVLGLLFVAGGIAAWILSRRRANDDDAYYKFDSGFGGGGAHAGGTGQDTRSAKVPSMPSYLISPWDKMRAEKKTHDVEAGNQTTDGIAAGAGVQIGGDDDSDAGLEGPPGSPLQDRPEANAPHPRVAYPQVRISRDSVESNGSSEIAAPMMNARDVEQSSQRLRGVGFLDNRYLRRNRSNQAQSDDDDVEVVM